MWEEPPQRKKRIVDLAGFRRGVTTAFPAPELPKLKPASPRVEATMKERRFMPGADKNGFMGGKWTPGWKPSFEKVAALAAENPLSLRRHHV
jgi:hypothetical protein